MSGRVSTEADLRQRGTHFTQTRTITTTRTSRTNAAQPRETSTAAIYLGDEEEEEEDIPSSVAASGHSSSRFSEEADGPPLIISPPVAFRSSVFDSVSGTSEAGGSVDHVEVRLRQKPAAQQAQHASQHHQQNVTTNSRYSAAAVTLTSSTSADRQHHQRQQERLSSSSLDAPVPAPRRQTTTEKSDQSSSKVESHHQRRRDIVSSTSSLDAAVPAPRQRAATVDNNYTDVQRQTRVKQVADARKGQTRHEYVNLNHVDSSDYLQHVEDDENFDEDFDDAGKLTTSGSATSTSVSHTMVNETSTLSSASKTGSGAVERAAASQTTYSGQWIGSVPLSKQLHGSQRSDAIIAVTTKLSSYGDSIGHDESQLFRVSPASVEVLDARSNEIIREYLFSEIVEHHAVTLQAEGRTSYLAFITHDRHYGHICHVFECDGQSARSLAAALYDVIVTSHSGTGKRSSLSVKKSEVKKKEKTKSKEPKTEVIREMAVVNGGVTNAEIVVDDHNNNAVAISKPVKVADGDTVAVRCHYIGMLDVSQPHGINILHRATREMAEGIPRDRWRKVTVKVTSSAVELFRDSKRIATYDLHNITFLGIDSVDKAVGAFVTQKETATSKQWFVHGFYCQPSAGPFCTAIKLACDTVFESRRRRESERSDMLDARVDIRRTQSTATTPVEHEYQRRLPADDYLVYHQPHQHRNHVYEPHSPQPAPPQYQRQHRTTSSSTYLSPYHSAAAGTLPRARSENRAMVYYAATAPRERRTQSSSSRQDTKYDAYHRSYMHGHGGARHG